MRGEQTGRQSELTNVLKRREPVTHRQADRKMPETLIGVCFCSVHTGDEQHTSGENGLFQADRNSDTPVTLCFSL